MLLQGYVLLLGVLSARYMSLHVYICRGCEVLCGSG